MALSTLTVTVIIATHNRKDSLLRTLSSLAQQTYPYNNFEVLLVDDGSTDGTETAIGSQTWPFNLRYHYQDNQGLANSRNWAVAQSYGHYIVFLDDDIIVNPQYLKSLIPAILPQCSFIAMASLTPPSDLPDTVFHQKYIQQMESSRVSEYGNKHPIPFYDCTGGAIALCRDDYVLLGGMQTLPHGGGTTWGGLDLAYRAYKAGFDFYRCVDAVAIHDDYAIQDLHTYSQRMYRAGQYAVLLLHKYPELEELVPLFRDRSHVNLSNDPPPIIVRKLWRSCIGSNIAMVTMAHLIRWLESRKVASNLLWKLYVWFVSSNITRGMRNGIHKFGHWSF
jgi:glycosyltransferase involved in cell wall biosynthesis